MPHAVNVASSHVPLISTLNARIAITFMTGFSLGYDWSSLNGLQSLDSWQEFFSYPTGTALGILNAAQTMGNVAGLLVASYPADYLGRKWGILIGNLFLVLGSVVQSVSPTVGGYIAGRLLVGFGLAISTCSCPSLIVELAHPKHRNVMTASYFACFLVGSVFASWITMGTSKIAGNWGWRLPTLLQIAAPIIQTILLVLFTPESPRIALMKNKPEEAEAFYTKFHTYESDPTFAADTLAEIKAEHEQDISFKQISWLSLINTPGNRKRTLLLVLIPLFSQLGGYGVIAYFLSLVLRGAGITSQDAQLAINGGLSTWQMIVALFAALYVSAKIGRRPQFIYAAVGILISMAGWLAASAVFANTGSKASSSATIFMLFVFDTFYNLSYNVAHVVYAAEISQTSMRVKYLAFVTLSHDAFIVLNSYASPLGLADLGWKFYAVCLAVDVVAIPTLWYLMVETKDRTLEQIAIAFDGEDAALVKAGITGISATGEVASFSDSKSDQKA